MCSGSTDMRPLHPTRLRAAGLGLVVMFLWSPVPLAAHGIGYRVLDRAGAITLACHYSDGSPVSYAETLVFGPEDSHVEFQNGRTDRRGMFSFCPDASGSWRIETNDGRGHRVDRIIDVRLPVPETEARVPGVAGAGDTPGGAKAVGTLTGVSLIFNVFAGLYLVRRVKKKHAASQGNR